MTFVSLVLSVMMLAVSACGSNSSTYSEKAMATSDYAYDSFAEESVEYSNESGSGESMVNDTSRKLIKTVDMKIETNDLNVMMEGISDRVNFYGGYIEYSYVYNGSESSYKSNKSASLTARIPSVKLDDFLNNIAETSNIVSKNINVTDVTLSYVDTEAKKDSLVTQQKRLLELMSQAETVEDIITIEDRLSNIEYELDSAERQIRSYDNQIDYSTVSLDISEVVEYTPVEPVSRGQKMKEGFINSIVSIGEGLLDFGVGFVIAIPYLIVWAIIVVIIVTLVKLVYKLNKKSAEKKKAKAEAKAALKAEKELASSENEVKEEAK